MPLFRRLAIPLLLLTVAAAAAVPLKPNLRGEVMILVYHNFGPNDARWTRSFTSFANDLERLDAAGYRPITLRQYISGNFRLPEGTSPVVLTFDDGSKYQMRYTASGKMVPDSAVGVWVAFAQMHPEFPVHGTFFINAGTDVFGQRAFIQDKLQKLVAMGSEIGNHTWDHANLAKLTPAQVEREVGMGQAQIDRWLPDYKVTSLALPFGVAPHDDQLVVQAAWTGASGRRRAPVSVHWHYSAVVLVGSGPAPSPLVAGLRAAHLPRIQAFTSEFNKWMNYFARHPRRRFVSDGQHHAAGSLPRSGAGG
ncbi:MAG: polysaccharide deacetylase family protein [Terriglobales bacterium]